VIPAIYKIEQINNSHYSHPFDGTVCMNNTQKQSRVGPSWLLNMILPHVLISSTKCLFLA
jgi:hypothetical protein